MGKVKKRPATKRRRRRLQPGHRRELLMDAAARAFGRLGVDGVRMDDVAAEAGVAKGLLYRHFPSKEALLDALMECKTAAFRSSLAARLAKLEPTTTSPAKVVADGLRMWVEQVTRDIADFNWVEPGGPQAYLRFCEEIRRMISDTIRAVAPTVSEDTAVLIAAALQGVAESMTKAWRERRESLPQDRLVALLVAFCLGGLKGTAAHLQLDVLLDIDSV